MLMYIFSGDDMGLDQGRENLYRVWDYVQDFKGKGLCSTSFPRTLGRHRCLWQNTGEYKVE